MTPPVQPKTPSVRLLGVEKRFGDLWAVRGVDLDLFPGEIHALLGENGAGKTTLMCLLAGLYRRDGGVVELFGEPVSFRSPREAMARGVCMVHQHFTLVPTLTVAENVLLGAPRIPLLVSPRRIERAVAEQARRAGIEVRPDARVGDLSLGEQQRVEILRVLARGARVLILDEPTAVLSPQEAEALFATLRRLADEDGCAVVLISHKLEEIRRVADRLTVMRRGEVVAREADPGAASTEELAAAIVGRPVSLDVQRSPVQRGPGILAVRGLHVPSDRGREAVRGIDLEVHEAEVLGLAGVAGNGQRELLETIAGLRAPSRGEVLLDGVDVTRETPLERTGRGLRFIPEDRNHTGTSPSLSVRENLLLRAHREPPCRRGLWLDLAAGEPFCRRSVESLRIAVHSLGEPARLLSGGNLQKVILARELSEDARIVLAMYPTRGLDAWATSEVRRLLLAVRARHAAILLCSEDLDELLALSDRIVVLSSGRVVARLEADRADKTEIGRLMTSAPLLEWDHVS
jgi:general nucleoside transport system ATP-binding protein